MRALADWRREQGHFDARRAVQNRHWFEEEVRRGLLARLEEQAGTRAALDALGEEVAAGRRTPSAAAAEVLDHLKG